ncbi:hypothetical protein [[Actinomadura] parvosata]
MADTHRAGARSEFIAALKELREAAGQPTYSQMHKLSRAEDIPKELPASTLNDILNGKRERLPDCQLVVSFVMVCHRHAESTGLPTDGLGSVAQWLAHWRAARNERSQAIGSYDLYGTPADEAERRTTRTVARLVRLAGDGDDESVYRLAIIKVLTGENAEARYWLHVARQRRHPGAEAFAATSRPEEFAAGQCFAYGQTYEQAGAAKEEIARFYYKLAADHGHPQAIERLRALRAVPFGKLLPAPIPAT